jgi:hypothetical protein
VSTLRILAPALLLAFACAKPDAPPSQQHRANTDSVAAAKAGADQAAQTDEWNRAEIVKRLGEAGLVVVDSNHTAHHPGIDMAGALLEVSESPLELYIYPSAAARKEGSAALDTMPNPAQPPAQRPRYIISGNIVAIHVTPKEALAERVENVLTARHAGAP